MSNRNLMIIVAVAAAIGVVFVLRSKRTTTAGGAEAPFTWPWESEPPMPPGPPRGSGSSGYVAGILAAGCTAYATSNGAPPLLSAPACGVAGQVASKFVNVAGSSVKTVASKVGSGISSVFHSIF